MPLELWSLGGRGLLDLVGLLVLTRRPRSPRRKCAVTGPPQLVRRDWARVHDSVDAAATVHHAPRCVFVTVRR